MPATSSLRPDTTSALTTRAVALTLMLALSIVLPSILSVAAPAARADDDEVVLIGDRTSSCWIVPEERAGLSMTATFMSTSESRFGDEPNTNLPTMRLSFEVGRTVLWQDEKRTRQVVVVEVGAATYEKRVDDEWVKTDETSIDPVTMVFHEEAGVITAILYRSDDAPADGDQDDMLAHASNINPYVFYPCPRRELVRGQTYETDSQTEWSFFPADRLKHFGNGSLADRSSYDSYLAKLTLANVATGPGGADVAELEWNASMSTSYGDVPLRAKRTTTTEMTGTASFDLDARLPSSVKLSYDTVDDDSSFHSAATYTVDYANEYLTDEAIAELAALYEVDLEAIAEKAPEPGSTGGAVDDG